MEPGADAMTRHWCSRRICPTCLTCRGSDRLALARVAVEELDSEVLVLDDGFQHRRLRRDLDLVLIDATALWGFGYLFPRGLMRERPAGLRRAGLVMLTRCDLVPPSALEELRRAYTSAGTFGPGGGNNAQAVGLDQLPADHGLWKH